MLSPSFKHQPGAEEVTMLKELDSYDWEQAFGYASFTRSDVESIHGIEEGANNGPSWVIYGRLKSGEWFLLDAGCDYTGWDCQAGGDSWTAPTMEDLVRWKMTDEHRARFGIKLELVDK